MEPATLVDIFRSNGDEPVLPVPQLRAKFHYHVGKLVQVRSQPKACHSFVFEHVDLRLGESMHLDHFQRGLISLKRKNELLNGPQPFGKAYQTLHVFGTLMTLIGIQILIVAVNLKHVETAVLAMQRLPLAIIMNVPDKTVGHCVYLLGAKWTFLSLDALSTRDKVSFSILICECLSTLVWACKLAHVEYVDDLA